MIRIVLASQSLVRQRLLRDAGLDFAVVPARIDEDVVKDAMVQDGASIRDVADRLAELKALRVSASHPEAIVIGADQILGFGSELVGKSENMASAKNLLRRLRGQTHELITACTLARHGAITWRHIESVKLRMRDFSDSFLDDYLAAEGEDLLSSVGCYRLEGRGVQLFAEIRGDYFAVLGLPLLPLLDALRKQGAVAP